MEGTLLDTLGMSGRFWFRPRCRTFLLGLVSLFLVNYFRFLFLAYYFTILIRVARNTLKYNRTAPSRQVYLDKLKYVIKGIQIVG